MKHKTTRNRRQSRQSVLEVRVMSPRIAWFGFLRILGGLTKCACLIAVLVGIGWGVWRGVQHAFYQNPDFNLSVFDLNPNPVIDEIGVAEICGIDLTNCPSLFAIDVKQATAKLKALPAITEAHIERHLPGTLIVRLTPRRPVAWISCLEQGLGEVRRAGAILVDQQGVAYPCPEMQLESALLLPVIELPANPDSQIVVGETIRNPSLDYCVRLLESARAADPDAVQWIDSIKRLNEWSLELVTRHGTSAVFSLGDHARQIESLRAALDHAAEKGYDIATINLIPKYNIPITLRDGTSPPKAIPVTPPEPANESDIRRSRDLSNLLQRN